MKSMSAFGEALRKLRVEHSENQTELGQVLGVSPQMVSKLETGKSVPSAITLKKLAEHYRVSIETLLGLERAIPTGEELVRRLPVLGKISAGKPLYAEEQRIGTYPVLPGVEGDFLLLVTGDSMVPVIPDQSYVVVKCDHPVSSGGIAVVMVPDTEAVVKRVYYDPNGVILKSENSAYPPLFFDKERWASLCRMIGKVTTVIHRLVE